MTLVPPVPAAVTVAHDNAAVDSPVVDPPVTGVADAELVLPVPPEPEPVSSFASESESEPVSSSAPEPAPASLGATPTPGPRLRHVRIDPPAGPRGEADGLSPLPGTPPRIGVVPVPQPSRTTSDRRSSTPSVRPVRLVDTAAATDGLPGATERPAAVTPVPLPVPRPATPAEPGPPAAPATPAAPPSTESRTEEPQP
ncbi:hypothetical protein [Streptomyces sp. SJL17-1]|uniref:hypothetical protein n=1 Tax=Streptomyces sp. SJL17-1 TaxID=2967223 RepID=UPI002966D839|nr:hypothetical protein [Streptomyces sp. SJL17-1]